MIVGDPTTFALESEIARAFAHPSTLALGFFAIHISSHCFGVRSRDATLLACSHDAVAKRIGRRGSHTASFVIESAGEIADAVRGAIYAPEDDGKRLFGYAQAEMAQRIHSSHLLWAPDGDEAFDDGSYVVQFDAGKRVRLIGFKSREFDYHHEPASLAEVWLDAEVFYRTLSDWRSRFQAEWQAAPKEKVERCQS